MVYSIWRSWSPALQKRCERLAFPEVPYFWTGAPWDVALSTTSCLVPNPRTHSSANTIHTPQACTHAVLCLMTPLVGSKLPPPHCLTA